MRLVGAGPQEADAGGLAPTVTRAGLARGGGAARRLAAVASPVPRVVGPAQTALPVATRPVRVAAPPRSGHVLGETPRPAGATGAAQEAALRVAAALGLVLTVAVSGVPQAGRVAGPARSGGPRRRAKQVVRPVPVGARHALTLGPASGPIAVATATAEATARPGQARVAQVRLLPSVARPQASGRTIVACAQTTRGPVPVARVAPVRRSEASRKRELAMGRVEALADALAAVPPFLAGVPPFLVGGLPVAGAETAAAVRVAPPRPVRGTAQLVHVVTGAAGD